MRLTEKFKDNYWDIAELNYNQENKSEIINKLGQLEDLMEKYGFETVDDLDNFIQSCINRIEYENKKEKYL